MALQQNPEQRLVVGRSSEAVLHHDVSGGGYRVAGVVVETRLMAKQLLHGDVVISLVLDAIIIGGIVEDSLRSEHLLVQLQFLHLLQFHDAHSRDELRYRGKSHQHVGLHLDALFLVSPSESAGVEQGVVAGDDELGTVYFPSFQVSLYHGVNLVVFLSLGQCVRDGVVDVRLGQGIRFSLLVR